MSILERLGFRAASGAAASAAERDTVRRIVEALDHLPSERARYLAGFAFILSRAARADLDVSAEETLAMEHAVAEHGALPAEQAIIVVQMAKTQSLLFGGTDNYSVTKEFARSTTRSEHLGLLRCLFAVTASDGAIRVGEENVVRQIAEELGLDHADFVAVRREFRDQLAVLRASAKAPSGAGSRVDDPALPGDRGGPRRE